MATQIVISYFATNPESLSRVRAEFDSVIDRASTNLTVDEHEKILRSELTMDQFQEFTYLSYVIQEALRFNPPLSVSTGLHF